MAIGVVQSFVGWRIKTRQDLHGSTVMHERVSACATHLDTVFSLAVERVVCSKIRTARLKADTLVLLALLN